MPAPRTRLLAVLAVAAATALVGCAPADASPPPASATPTVEPVFASDEEALAAAIAAYEAYLALSQVIEEEGGHAPDRIRDVVTPTYADELILEFEELASRSISIVGSSRIASAHIAQWSVGAEDVVVDAYMCVDGSDTRILDSAGDDITPASRETRVPLLVHFIGPAVQDRGLLVDSSELWRGDDFC
ncbi:hypothetical protein [Agromyces rhizosphaerae]|nr:hypothetical protein [Agromyces rhizosphaerae]